MTAFHQRRIYKTSPKKLTLYIIYYVQINSVYLDLLMTQTKLSGPWTSSQPESTLHEQPNESTNIIVCANVSIALASYRLSHPLDILPYT